MIVSTTGFFIRLTCAAPAVEARDETYEESVTLEDVYEPYLMQLGFLTRTPRGRCVTVKAYEHLGLSVPGGSQMEQLSF